MILMCTYALLTYFIADLTASSPTKIFIIVKLAAQTSVLLLAHFFPCNPMKYNYVYIFSSHIHICDLILENRPSCHIWYFKKYQF